VRLTACPVQARVPGGELFPTFWIIVAGRETEDWAVTCWRTAGERCESWMPPLARVKTAWLATVLKVIEVPSATPTGRVTKEEFVTPWIRSTARMLATQLITL
jgi:hypothetical protein